MLTETSQIGYELVCLTCKTPFNSLYHDKLYCSDKCRRNHPSRLPKLRQRQREFYAKAKLNPDFVARSRESSRKHSAKMWHTNKEWRIKNVIRRRIRKLLSRTHPHLSKGVLKYIGCTNVQLRGHLEAQFYGEMTWSNYKKYWVVDHIKSLSKFDFSKDGEIEKACHYTNLQPLTLADNSDKGKRDDWVHPRLR